MVIREILFPTDFSEPARYAGQYATMIARKLDASLQILHVPYVPFPTAMATHGRSGLRRWLLGSVTNKVLRTTDVPVLVSRAWSLSRESGGTAEVQPARAESTSRR